MARRRRGTEQAPEESTNTNTQTIEGPGPQATLTVRGSAEAVKQQLGVTSDQQKERRQEPTIQDDEKKKFVDALKNPKYLIRVKRMTPREFNGVKTNVEVWQAELPLGYQEIQEEIAKGFGGEKYRVAVVDPASNNTIAADTFVVDGPPLVEAPDVSQEELDRVLMRGGPKSAADISEEGLERRARLSAKMIEVEELESQLTEARSRRQSNTKQPAQDNTRVDDLERRLVEAKHQAELDARDRQHAEDMRQLRELIEKKSQPPPAAAGASETSMILQQMQKSQEAADKRFEALQKQMQDDKLNLLLDEVKSIRNKPAGQGGSLLEQAEAMLKLRKIFGWGGGDSDDEEEDDENDDRPWWERALDKLGGKLGDKLFEKFTAMEGGGEKVDRETFLREMTQHADQIAADAVKKKNLLPPPPARTVTIPIPPPPAAVPQQNAAVTTPVTALPPPPPAAPAPGESTAAELPAPPAAPPPAPAAIPQALTIEQEIVIRVSGVLEMIEREIELRPNRYIWNYEGAFECLPESVLEKVCAAPDPVAMIDSLAIEFISPEKIAEIKAKISGNPRIHAWLKVGHDELKEWFSEKMKDPSFDPFADDGEEEAE